MFGACADDCVAQLHAVQFSSATGTTGDGAATEMRKWQEKLLSNRENDMLMISSNSLSLSLSSPFRCHLLVQLTANAGAHHGGDVGG